ncbi:MAG: aspartate aminotransferase family protein [Gemmatimonadales bacterium]
MSHVFGRFTNLVLPTVVRGDGPYLFDADGKRYLDACGGAAVSCLGHSEPRVARAIADQLARVSYASTVFFTSEPAERLADELVREAPAGLTRVFFGSGGSEQVDGTLKLARQYFLAKGEPLRTRFISRRQSFHGNTLGALGITGNVKRREPYLPLIVDAERIAPCYAYRGRAANETDEAYGLRVANELEAALRRVGPETVIGFVAETVVGATLGAVPPVPGYFRRIREICDQHGILLILDEIMSGMGRTGVRFACAEDGVAPDLLVLAKGLGAGFQPISATLATETIYRTIQSVHGSVVHGHTYQAHPVACAAALAVQEVIRDDDLIANVRRRGESLERRLREALGAHPHVGDIRGRGLFWGVEFVEDRATKRPFPADGALGWKLSRAGMGHGVMLYPGTGTMDGLSGDHLILAPPYNVTEGQLDEMVTGMVATVHELLGR